MNAIKHEFALNQLVYTSFTDVGFALLASEQVPLHIQQTFLKQVVYRYWNGYEGESPGYRAAYLLQVTPEDCLFGWLYHDEWDEIARSHIPYFICYHLTEPLYALRIEKVCACLQKGPVGLVDRRSISTCLEPLLIKDVSSYQEASPGVVIPWEARQQIHTNLKLGKLTDLFILGKEQESVIDLSLPVEPQQVIAKDKSADNDSLLPFIQVKEQESVIDLSLPVEPQKLVAKDKNADNDSLLPFIPVKEKEKVIELLLPVEPQKLVAKNKSADNDSLLLLLPIKEKERVIELSLPAEPQKLVAKDKSAGNHSLVLDTNFILLLGITFGIITSFAVIVLIYVFVVMTSVRNEPTQSHSQNALPRTAAPSARVSAKP